ncbi:MAG: T9SS type A sorting domain-containing protein [Ignavibacteria bacterium]|nr:T9SS type A sorting domain-containing protein [Ignavibacteria bacterium]
MLCKTFKTDFDGNPEWTKLYGIGQIASGRFVSQTNDSGFIITGRRDTFIRAQVYVIKTDVDGNTSPWVNIEFVSEIIPESFKLYQNYPNPFNPVTTISYSLPKSEIVKIKIYDVAGKEILLFVNEAKDAGVYEIQFDGSNLASGIYFYKIEAEALFLREEWF